MSCAAVPTQQLLADLNVEPLDSGSAPGPPIEFNGAIYFAATAANVGRELFRLDALTGTPTLVADIVPGLSDSNPRSLTVSGGVLYFTIDKELYSTDGTAAGTGSVSGPFGRVPVGLTPLGNGVVFYVGGFPLHSLWISDGTSMGTTRVNSIAPLAARPLNLGNTAVLAGRHSVPEPRISILGTNGTAQGTVELSPSGDLLGLLANNRALFVSKDELGRLSLLSTDGTVAGNQQVLANIGRGSWRFLTRFGGSGALLSHSPKNSTADELWHTDGTPGVLAQVQGAESLLTIVGAAPIGGRTLFIARGRLGSPTGLYCTDGVAYQLVQSFAHVGNHIGSQSAIMGAGSRAFFIAAGLQDPANTELWVSDGTAAGTSKVSEIVPGDGDPSIGQMLAVGSDLFFAADDGVDGSEPWRSDGTAMGTVRIADLRPARRTESSTPHDYFDALGLTWFFAYDNNDLRCLWSTDGFTTVKRDDLLPPTRADLEFVAEVGNQLFFTVWGGLMVTDGMVVQPLAPNLLAYPASSEQAERDNRLLFFTGVNTGGYVLWEADADGHRQLAAVPNAGGVGRPFVLGQDVLFYGTEHSRNNGELWSLAAGGPLIDLNPNGSSIPVIFDRLGNRLLFGATDGVHGHEMWATDGTPAGTTLLADIVPGTGGSLVRVLEGGGYTRASDTAYFVAENANGGQAVWETEGTVSSTRLFLNLAPGAGNSIRWIFANGGILYASSYLGPGNHRWTSTDLQTLQTTTLRSGSISPTFLPIAQGSRRMIAMETGAVTPTQIWRTDGTVSGTTSFSQAFELQPDPTRAHHFNRLHVRSNGSVLFTADDGVKGHEPWLLDAGDRAVAQQFTTGGCARLGAIRLTATDPVLGGMMQVSFQDGTPSAGGLWLLGFPDRLHLGSGCVLGVDLSLPIAGRPVALDARGQYSVSYSVPPTASLTGLELRVQALLGPNGMAHGGPVLGFDLTNAVALRLGR